MNKQLLDQIERAMQAQHDTIARQSMMLDQKDQDIVALTASLKTLSQAKTQQAQQMPELMMSFKESAHLLITRHDDWTTAQSKQQYSQQILTRELMTLAERQLQTTKLLISSNQELLSLTTLATDTTHYEKQLAQLNQSQQAITKQVQTLNALLSK